MCGWCTTGDRTTTTFPRPMQPSNTHRTSYLVYEACSSSKSSSSYVSLGRLCSPFSTCDAPGVSSQPYLEGERSRHTQNPSCWPRANWKFMKCSLSHWPLTRMRWAPISGPITRFLACSLGSSSPANLTSTSTIPGLFFLTYRSDPVRSGPPVRLCPVLLSGCVRSSCQVVSGLPVRLCPVRSPVLYCPVVPCLACLSPCLTYALWCLALRWADGDLFPCSVCLLSMLLGLSPDPSLPLRLRLYLVAWSLGFAFAGNTSRAANLKTTTSAHVAAGTRRSF